jgi:peptide-methionine (R)-S-oxide reductase
MSKLFDGSARTKENFPVKHSDAEWQARLPPDAYHVLRKHGTERAGSSPLNDESRDGVFACAACGQRLFTSDAKFDSGTGWPSFFAPVEGAVETKIDRTLFMARTEVHCSQCGSHLGHMFEDGPAPTGQRYCMNGVSMSFEPE